MRQFLNDIRDFGNGAVHINVDNIKDFIEKYDNKELLTLFCVLIENSILKNKIRELHEKDTENMLSSINFKVETKENSNIEPEGEFV